MNREKLEHYIAKYKEHEANRTSTNDRLKYWNLLRKKASAD